MKPLQKSKPYSSRNKRKDKNDSDEEEEDNEEGEEEDEEDEEEEEFYESRELFGMPFMVQFENFRSCEYARNQIVRQAKRFIDPDWEFKSADSLPFTIHVTAIHNPLVKEATEEELEIMAEERREIEERRRKARMHYGYTSRSRHTPLQEVWEGSRFPESPTVPVGSEMHSRMLVVLEWTKPKAYDSENFPGFIEHPSFVEYKAKTKEGGGGDIITLSDCLDSYTKEEQLDEDSWYCSRCKEFRAGRMSYELWRVPDILVIHLKRFNCTARWREKIRTKVHFPINSLDMNQWASSHVMVFWNVFV